MLPAHRGGRRQQITHTAVKNCITALRAPERDRGLSAIDGCPSLASPLCAQGESHTHSCFGTHHWSTAQLGPDDPGHLG